MEYLLVSYHVSDVGVEGLTKAGLKTEERQFELKKILQALGADEALYLSTCNRTEFLFSFSSPLIFEIETVFGDQPRIFRDRQEIIQHLLGVALSRDSVVFGESQILGQFKRAYEQALDWGVCGPNLSPLLNSIIREAKSIRSRIGLSQVHSSISTVAGAKILSTLNKAHMRVLFIGSGETNLTLARYLKKRDVAQFMWSSRGHQRAVAAADQLGGEVLNWDLVAKGLLPNCDVVCVATHARETLIHEVGLLNANPQMVCDLSVPANVEQETARRLGIMYYGIETLDHELSQSQTVSQDLLDKLGELIIGSSEKIEHEQVLRSSKKLLMESFSAAQELNDFELDKLMNEKLLNLNPEQKLLLVDWAKRIVRQADVSADKG